MRDKNNNNIILFLYLRRLFVMVDSEALLPAEKEKNQSPVSSWVYYLSLVLAVIAILLAVMGAFKKVII